MHSHAGPTVRGLLALVLLAGLATIWPTETAEAAPGCWQPDYYCTWGGTNYGGDKYMPAHSSSDWPCGVFCSPDVDNNEDSLTNNEDEIVKVFAETSWNGKLLYCTQPGDWWTDIRWDRDNDGESHRQYLGTSICPPNDPLPY